MVTFIISTTCFGATHPRCPGEKGYYFVNYRHRNPTQGGFISDQAYVNDTDAQIFIGPEVAVCKSSDISGSAKIYGTATIMGASVSGHAKIYDNAKVSGAAKIQDNTEVYGNAEVFGSVIISGNAVVAGNAKVYNVSEDFLAEVKENARVTGNAEVYEDALVQGRARVQGEAKIFGEAILEGRIKVKGFAYINSGTHSKGVINPKESAENKEKRLNQEALLRKKQEKAKRYEFLKIFRELYSSDFKTLFGFKIGEKVGEKDSVKEKLGKYFMEMDDEVIVIDTKYEYPKATVDIIFDEDSKVIYGMRVLIDVDINYNRYQYFSGNNKQMGILGATVTKKELIDSLHLRYIGAVEHIVESRTPNYSFEGKFYFVTSDDQYVVTITRSSTDRQSPNGIMKIDIIEIRELSKFLDYESDKVSKLAKRSINTGEPFYYKLIW